MNPFTADLIITTLVAAIVVWLKLDVRKTLKVSETIHTLVNSRTLLALRKEMLLTRRIAQLNPGDSQDALIAAEAERAYHEQLLRQEQVDE